MLPPPHAMLTPQEERYIDRYIADFDRLTAEERSHLRAALTAAVAWGHRVNGIYLRRRQFLAELQAERERAEAWREERRRESHRTVIIIPV